MSYLNAAFGWMWRKKLFFGVILLSGSLFFFWRFPFNDLSDAVTGAISRATANQVYIQAEELNLHLFPQPAISADGLTIETTLPPIEAKWAKITPGLFSILFNIPTVVSAASGDAQAAHSLGTKIGLNVSAEGVWGGELDLDLGSGSKGEGGQDRSRVALTVSDVNLKEVGQWSELPVKIQGRANFASDFNITPGFSEQPEGEFELRVAKFVLPAGVINVPMGEASMPVSFPNLTLANVTFKGRLVGGSLIIEDGMFGQSQDPVYGRIKGQVAMRLIPTPQGVAPQFGAYNLTVDLTTNATVQKDMGFVFLLFDRAKQASSNGGAKYLFKATGASFGPPPTITQVSSF